MIFYVESLLPSVNELYGSFTFTMSFPLTGLVLILVGLSVFTIDLFLDFIYQTIK